MSTYWPWWAGAVGLALVTIVHTLATDRSLGVSSAWDRVLHWRRERELERMDEEFTDDRALAEALAAATAEQFGSGPGAPAAPQAPYGAPAPFEDPYGAPAPSQVAYGAPAAAQAAYGAHAAFEDPYGAPAAPQAPYGESLPPEPVGPAAGGSASATGLRPAPLVTQAALLVSIFLGGWIAAITSGRFQLRLDMGPGFRDLVTADAATMIGVLFAGGVLVGFGTRLAGGCSSGHGLSGCGRLRPVSIVATAVFFGTAVAVSFLLWKVI